MDNIDAHAAIAVRERAESRVKDVILALVFAKPLEQHVAFPKDWDKCSHVDFQTDKLWPDLFLELPPMIANLVGHIAHRNQTPIDVCIVRSHGVFSLVVRTGP